MTLTGDHQQEKIDVKEFKAVEAKVIKIFGAVYKEKARSKA